MSPLIGGDLFFCSHFNGVARPLVDDVCPNLTALKPKIPTAVALSVIHFCADGTKVIVGRKFDPGRDREGLRVFKIADIRYFKSSSLNRKGLVLLRVIFPRRCCQGNLLLRIAD